MLIVGTVLLASKRKLYEEPDNDNIWQMAIFFNNLITPANKFITRESFLFFTDHM